MLKKENRLTTDFEFNITRKYGSKINGRLCSIYYLNPRNCTGPVRVGIVVPKKISKVAVKRNKLKRMFREAVRDNLENLPKDLWIVVHPRSESLKQKYEKISTDVNKVLSEISVA